MAKKYTAAQKRAYAKRMAKMNKKKSNNRKKAYSGGLVISRPLLPQTQLVSMRYTTRNVIQPAQIMSDITDSAGSVGIHTMHWNNLYDPDYTSSTTSHHMDGARNHQPRMFDQYGAFYNKQTVIGAKAKITFMAVDRAVDSDPGADVNFQFIEPQPLFVGYLKSQYADDAAPSKKFDDLDESKSIVYKRLVDPNKPATFTAKWSLNKEPSRRSRLQLEASQQEDDWGADFSHDIISTQRRYFHIFAHPISVQETHSSINEGTPTPVDVHIEMEFITLLSDRKDVSQSS
jgi:hypothetical protein